MNGFCPKFRVYYISLKYNDQAGKKKKNIYINIFISYSYAPFIDIPKYNHL